MVTTLAVYVQELQVAHVSGLEARRANPSVGSPPAPRKLFLYMFRGLSLSLQSRFKTA
jgi:hypothetical protein